MSHDPERCKEIFAILSEYLDMELPEDACAAIEQHMAGCPPCVEFAESLRKTVNLCRAYEPASMPQPLSDRARQDLEDAWRKMVRERARY